MRIFTFLMVLLFFFGSQAQDKSMLYGKVYVNIPIQGAVHVYNKSTGKGAITSVDYTFSISASAGDRLLFSSLQFEENSYRVTEEDVEQGSLSVSLKRKVVELDEVRLGNTLIGNIVLDLEKIRVDESFTSNDFGIPGYKGKKLTQSERRLYTAGEFKPIMLLGLLLGGGMPPDPVINGISGKTKKLKERVSLESNSFLLKKIEVSLSEILFRFHDLDTLKRKDFFYFCEESADFKERCEGKSNQEILLFLEEKLIEYKENQK